MSITFSLSKAFPVSLSLGVPTQHLCWEQLDPVLTFLCAISLSHLHAACHHASVVHSGFQQALLWPHWGRWGGQVGRTGSSQTHTHPQHRGELGSWRCTWLVHSLRFMLLRHSWFQIRHSVPHRFPLCKVELLNFSGTAWNYTGQKRGKTVQMSGGKCSHFHPLNSKCHDTYTQISIFSPLAKTKLWINLISEILPARDYILLWKGARLSELIGLFYLELLPGMIMVFLIRKMCC